MQLVWHPKGVLGSAGGIDLTVNYIWRVIHVCHQYCSSETVVLYSVCGIDMPCGFLLWSPPWVTPIPLSPHTFISETELLGINSWG